jgi:hypothetical protein
MIPPFKLFGMILTDSISIAIITFITDISMCKLFSKKYNYDIHPNQVNIRFWFETQYLMYDNNGLNYLF